jgi:hypothetical protein
MKSSLFKGLLLASVLVVSVGCGKESKSKGTTAVAYNPYDTTNPYYQDPTVATQAAMANANAWYAATAETVSTIGQRIEQRVSYVYSGPNCSTKSYAGGFINFEFCKQSSATPTYTSRTVNVLQSNVKSQNPKLAAAFTPPAGSTLYSASETNSVFSLTGRVFVLTYAKPNGHGMQYVIDTGLNSAFNPVKIYDSEAASGEEVTNPYNLR